MMKLKFITNFFVIYLLLGLSTSLVKGQTSCPVFIAKPATFVSATATAAEGSMRQILDGEGTTGIASNGAGPFPYFYWLKSQNPVAFDLKMKLSSTISRIKFYPAWGNDEGAKNIRVRLYNGDILLGTESIVLPYMYSSVHLAILSKTYTNVTRTQLVILDDYGTNFAFRTSLSELVFGDTAAANPPTVISLNNTCPSTTVDLSTAHTGTIPTGANLVWYTNSNHTGTALSSTQITQVGTGTYYAFYFDTINNCFSPASNPVIVTIENCPSYCVTGCNPNTFVNSQDPNTLEYDNIVSSYHTVIVREKDGGHKIWGQGTARDGVTNLLSPTVLAPGSGSSNFNYTGTILRVASGSGSATSTAGIQQQHAILTTNGLYIWGTVNSLVSSSIKSTTVFGKIIVNGKADGLPTGVNPTDVKMMFGSFATLAIVTCSGEAWVLSLNGSKNGDGSTESTTNNMIWHRVKTADTGNPNLKNVVAIRGTPYALFALTSTGKLYTWGTGTYINNGAAQNRIYATEVTKPVGITPKMIGMTQTTNKYQTYYLLATNGQLFSMGNNDNRQLGDGTIITRTNWTEVTAISGSNVLGGNITWISPNEHDNFGPPYINVLTKDYKQWAWGNNEANAFGGVTVNENYDPIYMPGNSDSSSGLQLTDEIMAVESGGHITINLKKCSQMYGYVGHQMNGSLGNGQPGLAIFTTYTYNTAIFISCTNLGPSVKDIKTCSNTTANLNAANLELIPALVEWHATNDINSPVMTNITAVSPGIYYAFYTAASGKCSSTTLSSAVTVSYYPVGEATCNTVNCYKPAVTIGTTLDTQHGITSLGRAGADQGNWPVARKGAWTALESKTSGFVVNRIPTTAAITAMPNPVEGMMVYDEEEDCLKIYSSIDGTSFSWKCFTTPACPD